MGFKLPNTRPSAAISQSAPPWAVGEPQAAQSGPARQRGRRAPAHQHAAGPSARGEVHQLGERRDVSAAPTRSARQRGRGRERDPRTSSSGLARRAPARRPSAARQRHRPPSAGPARPARPIALARRPAPARQQAPGLQGRGRQRGPALGRLRTPGHLRAPATGAAEDATGRTGSSGEHCAPRARPSTASSSSAATGPSETIVGSVRSVIMAGQSVEGICVSVRSVRTGIVSYTSHTYNKGGHAARARGCPLTCGSNTSNTSNTLTLRASAAEDATGAQRTSPSARTGPSAAISPSAHQGPSARQAVGPHGAWSARTSSSARGRPVTTRRSAPARRRAPGRHRGTKPDQPVSAAEDASATRAPARQACASSSASARPPAGPRTGTPARRAPAPSAPHGHGRHTPARRRAPGRHRAAEDANAARTGRQHAPGRPAQPAPARPDRASLSGEH